MKSAAVLFIKTEKKILKVFTLQGKIIISESDKDLSDGGEKAGDFLSLYSHPQVHSKEAWHASLASHMQQVIQRDEARPLRWRTC